MLQQCVQVRKCAVTQVRKCASAQVRKRACVCVRVPLLPLFDGIGTARLGLEDALSALAQPGRLTASWFVESDNQLAPV
eukprot:1254214-Alexandrium_andersonii.AAC.1